MVSDDFEDHVERAVREHAPFAYQLRTSATWLMVLRQDAKLPEHGWKIHVSSRVATFSDLIDTLVPVLLEAGCSFKLARSQRVLANLNNGYSAPATVGKAFTIYPDQDGFRDLAQRLAELLRGHQGPRVLSDRAVTDDAPVYYRYGPFASRWDSDSRGRLITVIHGPEGDEFGGLATLRYRQPSWVTDPITGEPGSDGEASRPDDLLLGGYYRVIAGVFESGRGNVFRAVDERDGSHVVVKQARALVDEVGEMGDVRMRLRNERRVLQALDGVPGVPRFIDHFDHLRDEFLVTTDAGPRSLADDVLLNGRYAITTNPDIADDHRGLAWLGARLARILLALHQRGVISRDVHAKNIVVSDDDVTLVDFGLAQYDGLHIPGATAGYAPARQRRGEEPRDTDDLYGLGMVLLYAAQGVHPLSMGEDFDLARRQALQRIRVGFGERPAGIVGIIADLLSGDDDTTRAAARSLAAGDIGGRRSAMTGRLPAPIRVTTELAGAIADSLLDELLDQTRDVLTTSANSSIAHDASVYAGSAGIGLELLWHLHRPGVTDVVERLIPFTARAIASVNLPHGLLAGRTGAEVFLRRARAHGIGPLAGTPDSPVAPSLPDEAWVPEGDDLMAGAAGVGLGHLALHQNDGDPRHLDIVRRCVDAVLAQDAPASATSADTLPESAAVETSAGRAHGLAGSVEVLLYAGSALGDADILAAAAKRTQLLARRAESLARRTRSQLSVPLAASWCQGLAGIAHTLLHAGDVLDDPTLLDLARRLGDGCVEFLPHVAVPTQCCGLAGIGDLLIDLAVHDGDERYWDAASMAATHMLLRAAGTPERPLFVKRAPEDNSASWAFGLAGLLAFFRRLARHGGEIALPLPGQSLVS
jgi:serine/threonine protein kinase